MIALPSTRELRALDVLNVVSAGHIAVLVRDRAFEPHLHRGELAIVDTTDKDRVFGELYVITIEGGRDGPKPTIVELYKGVGLTDPTYGVWYAFSLRPPRAWAVAWSTGHSGSSTGRASAAAASWVSWCRGEAPLDRAAHDAGIASLGIADLSSFVDRSSAQPNVGSRSDREVVFVLSDFWAARPLADLSALRRCVILISQPHLGFCRARQGFRPAPVGRPAPAVRPAHLGR